MKGVNILNSFLVLAIIFAFGINTNLQAKTFKVDSKASSLKWHGEKVLGEHWGYVTIDNGWVKKDGENYTGEFWIDMTTITDEDIQDKATREKFVGHLKSDDFFNVDDYKMSSFKITKIEKKDYKDFNYVVVGDLTIKGITKQISFPAKIEFKDNKMHAKANFDINRTWWDIKYGSGNFFEGLGDKMIYDNVDFELDLVAKVG
jgi:polyisoprenoid-binding protein YceI